MSRCWHSSTSYFGFSSSYLTNSSTAVSLKSLTGKTDWKTPLIPSPSCGSGPVARVQEQVVARLLNLDQVRHLEHFTDLAVILSQSLLAKVGGSHARRYLLREGSAPRGLRRAPVRLRGLPDQFHGGRPTGRRPIRRTAPWRRPVSGPRREAESRPRKLRPEPAGSACRGRSGRARDHLSSTSAPAASSLALIDAASSFETPSLTALPPASTRSLASFRPRPVIARTSLMTLIFWAPAALRMTSNSVFSSSAAADFAAGGGTSHHHGAARGGLDAVLVLEDRLQFLRLRAA